MLARSFMAVLKHRQLAYCTTALLIGQLLYFAGNGILFAVALVAVLAVGLPFPKVLQSLFSRTIAAILLAFSFIQVAALIQFIVFPESDFRVLTVFATLLTIITVWVLRNKNELSLKFFSRNDISATAVALLAALPLLVVFFWGSNNTSLAAFGARQSQDGTSHSIGLSEMAGAEHFTYSTNSNYYPKGFHIAGAVFINSFGLKSSDNSWLANAQFFLVQYATWAFLVAFLAFYLARQMLGWLVKKITLSSELLLAFIIGPSLSLFYLIPFAHQGFLNYYYICAAVICSLIFLPGFKLKKPEHTWFVAAYFLLMFGAAMSWGPLLLPVSGIIPVLYLLSDGLNFKDTLRHIFNKKNAVILAGYALLATTLLLYLKFATGVSAFNAYGSIRSFNFAVLIAGIVIVFCTVFSPKLPNSFKNFQFNVLIPFFLLVGLLAAAQFFTSGEIRYYTIKTSYLLEMILLLVAGALLVYAVSKSSIAKLQSWIFVPVMFGVAIFLLLAVNANPLEALRKMASLPSYFENDVVKVTELGVKGELKGANNTILHYIPEENKIIGNALLMSWANTVSPTNENNAVSSQCGGTIFTTFAYGSGSDEEQVKLVEAIKTCIQDRVEQGKEFYIVTDSVSKEYLIKILGSDATFL